MPTGESGCIAGFHGRYHPRNDKDHQFHIGRLPAIVNRHGCESGGPPILGNVHTCGGNPFLQERTRALVAMGGIPSKPDPARFDCVQVIGAGFSRTGTNSLQLALEKILD